MKKRVDIVEQNFDIVNVNDRKKKPIGKYRMEPVMETIKNSARNYGSQ